MWLTDRILDAIASPHILVIDVKFVSKNILTIGLLKISVIYANITLDNSKCSNNPCGNGGTCYVRNDFVQCRCKTNFKGPRCEECL